MEQPTFYSCSICGKGHWSNEPGCAQTVTIAGADTFDPKDPVAVGRRIRALLLGLGVPTDPPWQHSGNDADRKMALDVAGICWKAPGEMAPACTCPWIDAPVEKG